MIIKCPECGRQVSEKAPTCPSCGVQIAGKIIRCQNCGEIYFIEDGMCPACHEGNRSAATTQQPAEEPRQKPAQQPQAAPQQPAAQQPSSHNNATAQHPEQKKPEQKKSNTSTMIVAVILAAIVCGGLFYFYQQAQSNKEEEEYEFALRSSDEEVLKGYLLRYEDAPQEHRDSIQAHLDKLQKGDEEWNNAVLSNSRAQLQAYIDNNPGSVHLQEARNKIDSLDWLMAQKSEELEQVQEYLKNHPEGRYIDEANILASKLKASTVLPDEKMMIQGVFRKFFQSVNSRNEDALISTVSMVLDNFLGKDNATSDDVVSFLHKIYKEGITNMNWRIDPQSYRIEKKEIAEEEFEYSVTFSARQEVEKGDAAESASYRVTAKVTNDGRISGFNLTKLN